MDWFHVAYSMDLERAFFKRSDVPSSLCDELITRPEESYRLWCVVCDLENLRNEEAMAHWGLLRQKKERCTSEIP